MDSTKLKEKLIGILHKIQADSGLECPPLTGDTKPIEDLPEFDSMVWPVAISILASEIDATIPNHVNIFADDTSKLSRSINETAVFVCDLLSKRSEQEASAV